MYNAVEILGRSEIVTIFCYWKCSMNLIMPLENNSLNVSDVRNTNKKSLLPDMLLLCSLTESNIVFKNKQGSKKWGILITEKSVLPCAVNITEAAACLLFRSQKMNKTKGGISWIVICCKRKLLNVFSVFILIFFLCFVLLLSKVIYIFWSLCWNLKTWKYSTSETWKLHQTPAEKCLLLAQLQQLLLFFN